MHLPISSAIQEWLISRVSVEQAEAEHMVDGVPFGMMADDWKELISQLSPECELWYFCSPEESWTRVPHMGMEGYAIVASGIVVDFVLTSIS